MLPMVVVMVALRISIRQHNQHTRENRSEHCKNRCIPSMTNVQVLYPIWPSGMLNGCEAADEVVAAPLVHSYPALRYLHVTSGACGRRYWHCRRRRSVRLLAAPRTGCVEAVLANDAEAVLANDAPLNGWPPQSSNAMPPASKQAGQHALLVVNGGRRPGLVPLVPRLRSSNNRNPAAAPPTTVHSQWPPPLPLPPPPPPLRPRSGFIGTNANIPVQPSVNIGTLSCLP